MLGSRVLIIDPEGEYNLEGFETISVDDFLDRAPNLKVFHFHVELLEEHTLEDDLCDLMDAVMLLGDLAVVFEEISDYCPNTNRNLDKYGNPTASAKIRTLYRKGRKRGIQCLAISQRTPEVHKTITSQSRTQVIFSTDEPNDLNTIRLRFGTKVQQQVQLLDADCYEAYIGGDPDIVSKIKPLIG